MLFIFDIGNRRKWWTHKTVKSFPLVGLNLP